MSSEFEFCLIAATFIASFQISKEDVTEWVFCELPRIRAKILECSARTGAGVTDVFRAFLQLAKITTATYEADSGGLRRRSSAYGSLHADNRVADVAARQRRDSVAGTATASDHSEVGASKFKPRSRSLIRRSSRKTAKLRNSAADATPAHEECTVS
uniref:Uncharacterized protein n=1 Tax=Strigamia maritima TaxID=126957 RepID=T1JGU2_STRMM